MSLLPCPSDADLLRMAAERVAARRAGAPVLPPPAPVVAPITVRLPWSVLVPDNAKYGVLKGKIILTATYRAAKRRATNIARQQCEGREPLEGTLAIRARVYPPNRERSRDIANMTKLVHDSLEGVCYANDTQLADVHWTREAADIDAPRVEITITSAHTAEG